jgi:hypothetical protein
MSIYSNIQANNMKVTQPFLTNISTYEGRSATQIKQAGGRRIIRGKTNLWNRRLDKHLVWGVLLTEIPTNLDKLQVDNNQTLLVSSLGIRT